MKKLSEIMDDLGFDVDGSTAVKEAFIKYLIKDTEGVHVLTPTEKLIIQTNPNQIKVLPKPQPPVQLSFEFAQDPSSKSRISGKRHKI